jgi:hypothetical protein
MDIPFLPSYHTNFVVSTQINPFSPCFSLQLGYRLRNEDADLAEK